MEYKELYRPSHHRAKVNGCVDEHIIIAEKILGRNLKQGEVVHHKDNNKINNDPNNLMIFISNRAHITYHRGGKLIPLNDGTFDCEGLSDSYCCDCGKKLKTKRSHICQVCLHLRQSCPRPDSEQLRSDVSLLKTNVSIAKKYGVSDKTVAKWRKNI